MLWTTKVWSGRLFSGTDYEYRIWKSIEYKYFPSSYREEMKNRRAYVVIFHICLYFFFLKGLLWNHSVTQNVMINIFLPIHQPKMSDWRFAWQNGYWRRPLLTHLNFVQYSIFPRFSKYIWAPSDFFLFLNEFD